MHEPSPFTRAVESRLLDPEGQSVVVLPTTREHFMCVSRNVGSRDTACWLVAGLDSVLLDNLEEDSPEYAALRALLDEIADSLTSPKIDWKS